MKRDSVVQFEQESNLIQLFEFHQFNDNNDDDDNELDLTSIWYTGNDFIEMRSRDQQFLDTLLLEKEQQQQSEEEETKETTKEDNTTTTEEVSCCARGLLTHEEACYSIELKQEAILAVLTEQERQWDDDIEDPELIANAYIEWTIENLEEAQERAIEDQDEIEDYIYDDRIKVNELLVQLKLQQQEQQQQEEERQRQQQQQQQQEMIKEEEQQPMFDIVRAPRRIQSLTIHPSRTSIKTSLMIRGPQKSTSLEVGSSSSSGGGVGGGRRSLLQRASSQRFCNRMEELQPLRQASMRHLQSKRQASMRHLITRKSSDESATTSTLLLPTCKESSLSHLMAQDSMLLKRRQLPRHLSCPRKIGHEPNVLRSMLLATGE